MRLLILDQRFSLQTASNPPSARTSCHHTERGDQLPLQHISVVTHTHTHSWFNLAQQVQVQHFSLHVRKAQFAALELPELGDLVEEVELDSGEGLKRDTR